MECPSCHTAVDGSPRFCPSCGSMLAAAPVETSADPLLGQTLGGKYRVVRLLGEGGMGAVYEGEQQLGTSKRRVAIKTLHPHLSRDPQIEARFQREVGTIAELEHPNTIQVYDFGSTPDGILYIVMEFLQGKSLADILSGQGPMSPDRVGRVLEQVCGSLAEAHSRGIVHRDLKPDNVVLVERAGQKDFVKVLDFGIAKRSREEDKGEKKLTQQGMVLGTPPYMSPEQFSGNPVDARSDIYSLAVMTYEMLTGKLPFQANTAWEWAAQHMSQPPVPIESLAEGARVPAAMRSALLRALAKQPADRFASVGDFVYAFEGKGAPATHAAGEAVNRARTEMATPMEIAGALGAPKPAVTQGVAAPAYTPAAGNMAFPTPVGVPQPPAVPAASNRRGVLLGAAAVVGVASIATLVFALRGGSSSGHSVELDSTAAAVPATSLTPTPSESAPSAAPEPAPAPIPPLATGGPALGGPSRAAPHPAHSASGSSSASAGPLEPAASAARALPAVAASAFPGVTLGPPAAPAQPAVQVPAAGKYDGIECQRARQFRALNRPREAQSWSLACIARGGVP